MKIVSIVGRKDSGKTSLTVKIIEELTRRGYKVGSIKHSHHQLDMDRENTDTWRHKQAGSQTVVGIGATSYFNVCEDLDLDRLLFIMKVLNPVDFVVIEGFKRYDYPKIATTEDVVDDKTIEYVNSFKLTQEGLEKLVDKIEVQSHDIINTLYADNCGFNDANKISQEIIDGNITPEEIDQVDTFLSVDGKVIGLNKFVNNYLRETTIGMIKTLNLKQYDVDKIENVQLIIDKEISGEKFEVKNDDIELLLNEKDIPLNKFTRKFIINTIFSMVKTLKTDFNTVETLQIRINEKETVLMINEKDIPVNKFVKNILKETVHGMLKSIKTREYGVCKVKTIEINIKN